MIKSAISFLLGCLLVFQLPSLPDLQFFWLLLLALIILLFSKTRLLALFILGFVWTCYQASELLSDRLALDLQGQNIVISGTISSIPEFNDHRLRFAFKPDQDHKLDLPKKLFLTGTDLFRKMCMPMNVGN